MLTPSDANHLEMKKNPIFETVRTVICDVVVKDFRKYSKYKSESKICSMLGSYCKNILLNLIVCVESEIDLTNCKLAKVYGIKNIFISNIKSKNQKLSGHVVEATKVQISSIHSEIFHNLSLDARNLPKLGGLNAELDKVKKLFYINCLTYNTKLYRPHGILLHGPPGCGKTSFTKVLAQRCGAILYSIDKSDLLTSDFGSGAASLKEIFKKALGLLDEGPVILFLDEIDMLCPRPDTASLGNKQLASALTAEMDKLHSCNISNLLIIGATNSVASLDQSLRRPGRFDQEILINIPSEDQRVLILQMLTSNLELFSDVCCKTLAQMTPGFVGADLKSLCDEAVNHVQEKEVTDLCMEDFYFALHKTVPSLKKGSECVVDLKPVKWEDIGSLEEIKMEMKQSLEWPLKYPDILRKHDIPPTKGILLYGPPGCCKTTLVRAAATSCNVSFLSLSGAQVYSAYVGESERTISQAFQKARALAPSILFFDEIETLVGKRGIQAGNNRVQERILSTMLNEMDGVGNKLDLKLDSTMPGQQDQCQSQTTLEDPRTSEIDTVTEEKSSSTSKRLNVIVVGATNRPDMLDAAILRPGRLDKHIYVPPPDQQVRKAILEIYTSKMSCGKIDVDQLATKTDMYSGADLKNLCKEAGLQAVREQMIGLGCVDEFCLSIKNHHFNKALESIKPSLTQECIKQFTK